MKSPPWARRLIPTSLGAAMLAIIVVAALTPNIGVVSAQGNSQYNSNQPVNNTLEYALIGVLVAAVVGALLALIIIRRRRQGGRGGGAVAAWEQPQGGASGPTMDNAGPSDFSDAPPGGAASYGGAGAAAVGGSYDEASTPVDSGPEWAEAAPVAPVVTGAPLMDESEPDIDRLMKELDQISDDILKRSPPKKPSTPEPSAGDAPGDT